jgi:hypothetical protein
VKIETGDCTANLGDVGRFCSILGHIIGLVQLGYGEPNGEPTQAHASERPRTLDDPNLLDLNVFRTATYVYGHSAVP